jgi:hypothetical protein
MSDPNLNLGFLLPSELDIEAIETPTAPRPICPDGGTCHHHCPNGSLHACFRVSSCAPLSGVYTNDRWPDIPKET